MKIQLTIEDIEQAAMIGVKRRIGAMRNQLGGRYGIPPNNLWQIDINACIAELAVARYTQQIWHASTKPEAGDVGNHEVRSTTYPNGSLILHPADPDDAIFWLVTGDYSTTNGNMFLRGWIKGKDGKQPQHWTEKNNNKRPAYFIKQQYLNPPETWE